MCKSNFDSIDAFSPLGFYLLCLELGTRPPSHPADGLRPATAPGRRPGRTARVSRAIRPREDWEAWSGAETCALAWSLSAISSIRKISYLPTGPVTSYEQLHGNWIKSADCESAGLPDDQNEVNCICQKIM